MSPVHLDAHRKALADRIREVRERSAMNQDEFAAVIGVTRAHLSDIETYRIEASLNAIYGVLGLHHAGLPLDAKRLAEPVDARWLLLGPLPLVEDYRPARRKRLERTRRRSNDASTAELP